jgi:mannan endo-1,4-beta-mannosidase
MSSSLIGTKFLGSIIVQDPKKAWAKIDGVVLGDSLKYSFSEITSTDIGQVLDSINIASSPVVIVNYNWSNGKAYVRSGFAPQNAADCYVKTGFTAFILKSKIVGNPFIASTPSPSPSPSPSPAPASPFVTTSNGNFVLNGEKFVPVGFNAYWMGLDESYSYPPHVQIEEMFTVAKTMAATAIRSHTLGHSSGSQNSLRPKDNNLNAAAWEPIDYAFSMARKYNIRLICPLTDNYWWYNGNYGDYAATRGLPKTSFWTDANLISDFKNYVYQWLNHVNQYTKVAIKDDPYLLAIETGNELGNIRNADNSVPPASWLSDITKYIKSIDSNHVVLDGADECLGQSNDFAISTIDAYSRHFYSDDPTTLNNLANKSASVGKPFIVGEYDSHATTFLQEMEANKNVKGSFFWSVFPHVNGVSGAYVTHDDGYSQYPYQGTDFLRLSNHIRRMQGLPEITSLP